MDEWGFLIIKGSYPSYETKEEQKNKCSRNIALCKNSTLPLTSNQIFRQLIKMKL